MVELTRIAHDLLRCPGSYCSSARTVSACPNGLAVHLRQHADYVYNVDDVARYLGTFEQSVLLALVRPQTSLGKEAYGRAILKEVQHRLQREVAAGAVYATLERLEAKGLISSRLAAGTAVRAGRPKRHYAIEAAGLRALNAAKAETDRLWVGLRAPLKGAI
jgi:PadR family transcriptional regulator PadR